MADYTERFSEAFALLAQIAGNGVNSEQNTGYVSFQNYHRGFVILCPINLGSDLDVDLEQATTTAGAGAKSFNAAAKDITVQQADTLPSIIEFRNEEFDVTNSFDCLNVEVTPTVASTFWCGLFAGTPRFAPVPTTVIDSITD